MADIFKGSATAGIQSNDKIRLTVQGLESEDIWLEEIQGTVKPEFEIMYTFDKTIFINTFLQKLSSFVIAGRVSLESCSGGNKKPAYIPFYKKYNIVNSKTPIKMTFDGLTIKGWVTEAKIGPARNIAKESIEEHNFTLTFLGLLMNTLSTEDTQAEGLDSISGAFDSVADALSGSFDGVSGSGVRDALSNARTSITSSLRGG